MKKMRIRVRLLSLIWCLGFVLQLTEGWRRSTSSLRIASRRKNTVLFSSKPQSLVNQWWLGVKAPLSHPFYSSSSGVSTSASPKEDFDEDSHPLPADHITDNNQNTTSTALQTDDVINPDEIIATSNETVVETGPKSKGLFSKLFHRSNTTTAAVDNSATKSSPAPVWSLFRTKPQPTNTTTVSVTSSIGIDDSVEVVSRGKKGNPDKDLAVVKQRLESLEKSMLLMTRMLQDSQQFQQRQKPLDNSNNNPSSNNILLFAASNGMNGNNNNVLGQSSGTASIASSSSSGLSGQASGGVIASSGNGATAPATALTNFVDAIRTFPMVSLSMKNIERCSVTVSFFLGCLIGASLLDRLWLIGGIATAFYASHAIYEEHKIGYFLRKLGVMILQVIRDWQEKYNQMVIFYRTGRLAFYTSKTWEKYDNRFSITQKMNTWKQIAMERAIQWNSTIKATPLKLTSSSNLLQSMQQIQDVWKVMTTSTTATTTVDINKKKWNVQKYYPVGLMNKVNQNWQEVSRLSKKSIRTILQDVTDTTAIDTNVNTDQQGSWWSTTFGNKASKSSVILEGKKEKNVNANLFSKWFKSSPSTDDYLQEEEVRLQLVARKLKRAINNAIGILLDKEPSSLEALKRKQKTKVNPWQPVWMSFPKPNNVEDTKNNKKIFKYKSSMVEKSIALLFLLIVFEGSKYLLRFFVKTILTM